MKFDAYLISYKQVSSRWITDITVKDKTTELKNEVTEEKCPRVL